MVKVRRNRRAPISRWLDVTAVADKIGAEALAAEANRNNAPSAAPVTPETMVERYLVKHAKVHLNQGASYGFGGANHMRMNIATSRKLVELALDQHGGRAQARVTPV